MSIMLYYYQVDWLTGWLFWLVGPFFGATSPSNACHTPLWLAGGGGEGAESGSNWSDCRPSERVHPLAADRELARTAWVASMELIQRGLGHSKSGV